MEERGKYRNVFEVVEDSDQVICRNAKTKQDHLRMNETPVMKQSSTRTIDQKL